MWKPTAKGSKTLKDRELTVKAPFTDIVSYFADSRTSRGHLNIYGQTKGDTHFVRIHVTVIIIVDIKLETAHKKP